MMIFQLSRTCAAAFATMLLFTTYAAASDESIKLEDCPKAVRKTFRRECVDAKIEKIEKEKEDGKTYYEAEVEIDDKNYVLVVAADGTLIGKNLDDDEEEDDEEDQGGEEQKAKSSDESVEQISFSDCPKAVRKTLKREAMGAEIKLVDKEEDGGNVIYEVDVDIDGRNYEIKVAKDGVLLSKSLDEDDEE